MIKLENIHLHRGAKALLQEASLTLHADNKAALIGANGAGKSSLFKLLLGELHQDSGLAQLPADWRIAHMAQEVATSAQPALDYVLDGDSVLRATERALAQAQQREDFEAVVKLHEQLDNIDGYNATVRAAQLMQGLGFSPADCQRPANSFSGGWRIRLNLAQALMCPSDLLLLDEPTNHLDMDATLWLEQWLQRYPGTLLLISHDRDFIDAVCQLIVHIEHRQLFSYRGNYSAFERQRAERLAQQQANFEKQQRQISHINDFVRRFRAKATKARQAQSRIKELERMELIAPAHIDSPFDFSFPEPVRFSDPLLNLSHARIGYGDTTILGNISISIHPGTRIGLLGANGAGKSSLLKTLATQLPLLQGERSEGEHLKIGYFSQHQLEALDIKASPALHLQRLDPKAGEQQIRNFLGGFNFRGDMALDPIRHFSGGEKARLALAIVAWQAPNLLLLDEPTNHLDLEMRHALTMALQDYSGAVVVVSHDRHLLRNTVDQFLLIDQGRAEVFDGDLQDYGRWLLDKTRQQQQTASKDDIRATEAKGERKQQRQQSAALRKQLNPLRNAIKKIEQQMQQLELALSAVEQQLHDSALYEAEQRVQLQQVLARQQTLRQDYDNSEQQWLQLNEELEALLEADS